MTLKAEPTSSSSSSSEINEQPSANSLVFAADSTVDVVANDISEADFSAGGGGAGAARVGISGAAGVIVEAGSNGGEVCIWRSSLIMGSGEFGHGGS